LIQIIGFCGCLTRQCRDATICRPVPAWVEKMECSMVDRHWVGDMSLAVLLALPLAALASAQPNVSLNKPVAAAAAGKLTVANTVPSNGRISLLG